LLRRSWSITKIVRAAPVDGAFARCLPSAKILTAGQERGVCWWVIRPVSDAPTNRF